MELSRLPLLSQSCVAKSPDARPHPDQGDDLYRIGADGEGLTRLTFSAGAEWNPYWGLDGRIYFNAIIDGKTAVWSLKAD